jgi:BirA family transcriptional regulator, biotin operon repressor / biotin---[acetyl-CoA-carboxylase] ligase
LNSKPLDLTRSEPLPADLAQALEQARQSLDRIGAPLHYYGTVGSTNDIAASMAEQGAAEGTTVVAERQTTGRGRLGRIWFSAPGAGLYVSVIIRLNLMDRRWASKDPRNAVPMPARLTLLAGVSLAEAITATSGLAVEIKWPNDIVCSGRKLAGILAEGIIRQNELQAIILGFGINVRRVEYPPEIAARASSLEAELGRPVDRGALLAETLSNLGKARNALRNDAVAGWFDRWRALSPSVNGALVEWRAPDGIRRGKTAGLDQDGALLVEAARGLERVMAGEVIWL